MYEVPPVLEERPKVLVPLLLLIIAKFLVSCSYLVEHGVYFSDLEAKPSGVSMLPKYVIPNTLLAFTHTKTLFPPPPPGESLQHCFPYFYL